MTDDELALVRTARSRVFESVAVLNTALTPIFDAPGRDTDTVCTAIDRLWGMEDNLAHGEQRIQRRNDGDE